MLNNYWYVSAFFSLICVFKTGYERSKLNLKNDNVINFLFYQLNCFCVFYIGSTAFDWLANKLVIILFGENSANWPTYVDLGLHVYIVAVFCSLFFFIYKRTDIENFCLNFNIFQKIEKK